MMVCDKGGGGGLKKPKKRDILYGRPLRGYCIQGVDPIVCALSAELAFSAPTLIHFRTTFPRGAGGAGDTHIAGNTGEVPTPPLPPPPLVTPLAAGVIKENAALTAH